MANADQLLIIASVNKPNFSSNRTDRILAACEWNDLPAILVLNKIDLDKKDVLAEVGYREVRAYFEEFDEDGDGTGHFARSEEGEACEGWLAYLVAVP